MICLCERIIDGLVVKLWEESGRITITVSDVREDENFGIEVEPDKALDAFYHPFAYKARAEGTDRPSDCLHFYSNSD